MSKKKQLNENAINRFVDTFFQSIINKTTDRFLQKAKGSGVHDDIINKMREIEKSNKELDQIIRKYSK